MDPFAADSAAAALGEDDAELSLGLFDERRKKKKKKVRWTGAAGLGCIASSAGALTLLVMLCPAPVQARKDEFGDDDAGEGAADGGEQGEQAGSEGPSKKSGAFPWSSAPDRDYTYEELLGMLNTITD